MTPTGALIMSVFAAIWWTVGLRAAGHGPALVYLPPLGVTLALAGSAWRLARPEQARMNNAWDAAEAARRDRLVMWASVGEGVMLFLVAGILLPSTGHRDATVSAIALIVGAHFVPLARGLPARAYYLTATGLIALGVGGFGVRDLALRITIVTTGAAVILWLTALGALRHGADQSEIQQTVA